MAHMDKKKSKSERRKIYNSDKTSVQIYKSTHEKLKEYCENHNIKMKNVLEEIILKFIK